ncbi:MAG TPA: ATPase, partial [Prolixibacteraceae bacterium]|nr:ATPase [Prolixibacteraceae bacterium]
METPFVFGKHASSAYFTNRTDEIKQLSFNFQSLINTVIISPRRWGKSSLVLKAAEEIQKTDKNIRFCFIDMYNIRTENQFYQLLAQEVMKALSSKLEEILDISKNYLTRIIPKISFSPDPASEFSISMDWEEVK